MRDLRRAPYIGADQMDAQEAEYLRSLGERAPAAAAAPAEATDPVLLASRVEELETALRDIAARYPEYLSAGRIARAALAKPTSRAGALAEVPRA